MKIDKYHIFPFGKSHLIYPDIENNPHLFAFGDEEPATTFISLSGGIDSTYTLYEWLKMNPDENCVVHHIEMIYDDNRHREEKKAVYKILKWLDSKGLNNYFYLQSKIDFQNTLPKVWDVETCGYFTGIVLRNERWHSIKNILLPIYDWDSDRELRRREITTILAHREDYEFFYPLAKMTKKEVIETIPFDLLKLTWWCRTPKNKKRCGMCHSCQEMSEIIEEISKNI